MRPILLLITCVLGAALLAASAAARPPTATVRTHTGTHPMALGLVCAPKQLECKGLLSPFDFKRARSRVPTFRIRGREVVRFTLGFKPAGVTLTAYRAGNRVVTTTYPPHARGFSWQPAFPAAIAGRGAIVVITAITKSKFRYAYGARFVR